MRSLDETETETETGTVSETVTVTETLGLRCRRVASFLGCLVFFHVCCSVSVSAEFGSVSLAFDFYRKTKLYNVNSLNSPALHSSLSRLRVDS